MFQAISRRFFIRSGLAATIYLMKKTHYNWKLTPSGKIRGFLLAVALFTGILLVANNLPGVRFSMNASIVINFAHMGTAVLFMVVSIVTLFGKRS